MNVATKQNKMLAIPMAVIVGTLFCLQFMPWEPIVYAGTLQDVKKAGKKAVKDTEKAAEGAAEETGKTAEGAAKGAEKGAKGAAKGAEKAGKDAVKGAEKGVKGVVKGTEKALDQAGDAAKSIPGFGKGKKRGSGESDEGSGSSDDTNQGGGGSNGENDGEQAGLADDDQRDYRESSSEEPKPPVDFNEMKGQIPGYTPFGQEESGSSEGSSIEGGKPWYEKLGKPGGGRPPSKDEDDDDE